MRGPDGRFHDIAAQLSLNQPLLSRGIATADVDGDGRLDYAVANQWGTSFFYRNESNNPGAFVGLRLRLPVRVGDSLSQTRVCREGKGVTLLPSRPAIGAEARVFCLDEHHSSSRLMAVTGIQASAAPICSSGWAISPLTISSRSSCTGATHVETFNEKQFNCRGRSVHHIARS